MQRRDVLRLLSSVAALSALPQEAFALLAQANNGAARTTAVRTLSSHQDATVACIAEMIIPETDTPGAKGAKVNEFIDLLLTEWFEPAETKQFLSGLDQVDEKSRSLYSATFVDAKPGQQVELLKQLDDAAMEFSRKQRATRRPIQSAQMAAQPDMQKPEQQESKQPPFFYQFKRLTLVGYYTSEIGFETELGKTIIPSGHSGCAPLEVRK